MKYAIDFGHGLRVDGGALGIKFEETMIADTGQVVVEGLKSLGHEVVLTRPTSAANLQQSLAKRCRTANWSQADVFVCLHFNAFNGRAYGSEVFALSDAGRRIALPVLAKLTNLGFYDRGVKNGSHLAVVKNTNMPAILIEPCFCDNPRDMQLYDPAKIGNAIVAGLTGTPMRDDARLVLADDDENDRQINIQTLQSRLNSLGFPDKQGNPLTEDGIVGIKTKQAVQGFQRMAGMQPNMKIDQQLWDAVASVTSMRLLRVNHGGEVPVRCVQWRLGIKPNGVFDAATEKAVKQFQDDNNLVVDGIVGFRTWLTLLRG